MSSQFLSHNLKENRMKEIFISIIGFDGFYQISNYGRVKSLRFNKERIIKSFIGTGGYLHTQIKNNCVMHNLSIHRLVAKHFISNPDSKPDVNHIDGNKLNNRIENLEWCTKSENIRHSFKIGTHPRKIGTSNSNVKITESQVLEIRKLYDGKGISMRELANKYGLGKSSIYRIVNNISWSHIKKTA